MPRFFPRDVIRWDAERLHPLRAFALRSLEPAGITGLVMRVARAAILASPSWVVFVAGVVAAVCFLCGMLTWHLGHYPLRRWPGRVAVFVAVEAAAELGMSSVLIALRQERIGSRLAGWGDWWPLAGRTLLERALLCALFALVLAAAVQAVRRLLDRRATLPA
ncbi:MAG: hypothetical protein KJT01_14370 [Gemmatimonadetes bacterium]|nr:hypothetical protein [Gemmatimonadota bacterium]